MSPPDAQPLDGAGPVPAARLEYQTPPVDPDLLRRRRAGRPVAVLVACGVVVAAWVGMLFAFDALRVRLRLAEIRVGQTPAELATFFFVQRLTLCWVWTLFVASITLVIARRRAQFAWMGLALVLGLLSAALWGANYGGAFSGLRLFKAPKILANVMLVMVLVAHVALVTGAIQDRRFGPKRRPA